MSRSASTQYAPKFDRVDARLVAELVGLWGEALNAGKFSRARQLQQDLRNLRISILWVPPRGEQEP